MWLASSSALDPLEGLLVFQIWCECRPRFGDTNLAKKNLTLKFRLGMLQTLLLKNHIVREVGCFLISCHICVHKNLVFSLIRELKTSSRN